MENINSPGRPTRWKQHLDKPYRALLFVLLLDFETQKPMKFESKLTLPLLVITRRLILNIRYLANAKSTMKIYLKPIESKLMH